jgi:histidyl-tRNA synthetase
MITLDLGLARGLSYYTGVVFTLSHSSGEGVVLLGSGGRYDGLVRALGGSEDVPALGYAYNLEDVIALQSRSEVEADS